MNGRPSISPLAIERREDLVRRTHFDQFTHPQAQCGILREVDEFTRVFLHQHASAQPRTNFTPNLPERSSFRSKVSYGGCEFP